MHIRCYGFKRNARAIVPDPKKETIKHAIKRECKQAGAIEESFKKGYRFNEKNNFRS